MANKYDTCTFLDKEGTGVFVAIIMRSVTYYIFFFNISISQKRKIYLIFDIKYAKTRFFKMTILNYLFSKDMIRPFSVMVVPNRNYIPNLLTLYSWVQ